MVIKYMNSVLFSSQADRANKEIQTFHIGRGNAKAFVGGYLATCELHICAHTIRAAGLLSNAYKSKRKNELCADHLSQTKTNDPSIVESDKW